MVIFINISGGKLQVILVILAINISGFLESCGIFWWCFHGVKRWFEWGIHPGEMGIPDDFADDAVQPRGWGVRNGDFTSKDMAKTLLKKKQQQQQQQ